MAMAVVGRTEHESSRGVVGAQGVDRVKADYESSFFQLGLGGCQSCVDK